MGGLRLLLVVVFGACLFEVSIPFVALARQPMEPSPTDADINQQIQQLDPKNTEGTRLQALRWLAQHFNAENARLAVPALEMCVRTDPTPKLREAGILSLVKIVQNQNGPCPLAIAEAFLDRDIVVSQAASALAGDFKTFAPGCVEVLLRCAESKDDSLRGGCLTSLAHAGRKDKKVLEALAKLTHDKSFSVRHNAHCALLQANDNLQEFLAYLVRLQENPEEMLGQVDTNSEAGKRELAIRNLALLGSATIVIEWSDKRAVDLAAALLKLLQSPTPSMRRGAARLIGVTAEKMDLPHVVQVDLNTWKKLLEPAQQVGKPPKSGKESKKSPVRSKVAGQLAKEKVEDRLRELRDNDRDSGVRSAAGLALERFLATQQ